MTMEIVKSPKEIADAVLPSIVLLEIESANDRPYRTGSGFFVGEGEIVTNFHVVEDARRGSAKLFGQDEWYDIEKYTALDIDNDLIVLKIEDPDQATVDTPALPLGNSNDIHTGDTIYAVGNPAGWEGTISDGIISGIRQEPLLNKRIQITAPISPGSSGGPVLNTKGEVIGVVSGCHPLRSTPLSQNPQDAQYVNVAQNLNFAIPSNYLKSLFEQRNEQDDPNFLPLAKLDRVRHIDKLGWIGLASYTFPLLNQSNKAVKNVRCHVIFRDKEGSVIKGDIVVFPWLIPANRTKVVIRLAACDTTDLGLADPSLVKILQKLDTAEYNESDINRNPIESFLLGLADLLLTNMDHAKYSSVKPHVKRLTVDYEIRVVDLEVVD